MDDISPRQLVIAARIADALVYAVGAAGVLAGALLLQDGMTGFAVVAWALTFVAGAALRLLAWGVKALARLLQRTEGIELALRDLHAPPRPDPPGEGPTPDPYRRWDGWH